MFCGICIGILQTFVLFHNLDRMLNWTEAGKIADVLWNLFWHVTAPYSWYQTLKPSMLELGFVKAGGPPCIMI